MAESALSFDRSRSSRLHRQTTYLSIEDLDRTAAVLDVYGFSADQDLLSQLLEVNLEFAGRVGREEPVTSPGVPPDYPDRTNS